MFEFIHTVCITTQLIDTFAWHSVALAMSKPAMCSTAVWCFCSPLGGYLEDRVIQLIPFVSVFSPNFLQFRLSSRISRDDNIDGIHPLYAHGPR